MLITRFKRALVVTTAGILVLTAVALADNLQDDLVAAQSGLTPTISEGGSFSQAIQYNIQNTGAHIASFPASVSFSKGSAPSWVSISASSHSFSGYNDVFTLTVSGTAPSGSVGTYSFDVTASTSVTNLNTNPAKNTFTVTVNEPAPPADSTAPVITPLVTGTLGDNDWYVTDVTVSWSIVDNESAVSSSSGCDSTTISADTAGTTLTCSATSSGGTASNSVTIKRDATAPTISGSAAPAANGAGWNNSDVTVSYTCSDAMSGIASCTSDETLSTEGAGQSSTGTAVDNAGNSSTATVNDINIDKTAPSVALVGGPADGDSYYFGFVPAAPTCSASDALSGLDGSCSVSGYSAAVGSHTVTASASDVAGNSASDSHTYTVLAWTTRGFYAPVDMNGVVNTIKGGQTVPLKFELFAGTTELKDVSYVNTFTTQLVPCSSFDTTAVDAIEIVSTGGTTLRFDSTGDQFIQNWQTPKTTGKCYVASVSFDDGSTISANFQTK